MIVSVIVGITSIWAAFDSHNHKISTTKGRYSWNTGALAWFISCLALWLIAFPAYIAKKTRAEKSATGKTPVIVSIAGTAVVLVVVFITAALLLGWTRLSTGELEAEVRRSVEDKWRGDSATHDIRMRSLTLVHRGGNDYRGVLVADVSGSEQVQELTVTYDGRNLYWSLKGPSVPSQTQVLDALKALAGQASSEARPEKLDASEPTAEGERGRLNADETSRTGSDLDRLTEKVRNASDDIRIKNTLTVLQTVKIASFDHYARYGKLNTCLGTTDFTSGTTPIPNFCSQVLIPEGLLNRPFSTRIGGGDPSTNAVVRLVTGVTANEGSGYRLDGERVETSTMDYVVEAVIYDVSVQNAKALNDEIDSVLLGAPDSASADSKGRVEYAAPSDGVVRAVYIYITGR